MSKHEAELRRRLAPVLDSLPETAKWLSDCIESEGKNDLSPLETWFYSDSGMLLDMTNHEMTYTIKLQAGELHRLNEQVARAMLTELREFYEEQDGPEDALQIAYTMVCDNSEDDETARTLVYAMGYIARHVLDKWKLEPDTRTRMEQIKSVWVSDADECN